MNKKNLANMSINQLLAYRKELICIREKIEYEADNWIKAYDELEKELVERTGELDFLILEAELDRTSSDESNYGYMNNLH